MISQPKAPDPYATAAAQGTINKQTAISQQLLNSMDQTTPDGSLTYSENGSWSDGTPKIGVTQTLSPNNQQLYDTNQGTQLNLANIGNQQSGQIGQLLSTPFDMSQGAISAQTAGMPGLPAYRAGATPGANPTAWGSDATWGNLIGNNVNRMNDIASQPGSAVPTIRDFSTRYTDAPNQVSSRYTADPTQVATPGSVAARYTDDPTQVATRQIGSNDQLEGQLYDAAFSRYQPQLDQQKQSLEADLANRGLKPGSTGYDNAMQGYDNSVNDLRSQTFLNGQGQAFQQSAARAQNDFQQDLASQGQYYGQKLAQNNQNFNQDVTSTGQDFQQRLAAQGQDFQQQLTANQQNFGQDLSASGQAFQQQLGANQQNFAQDAQHSNQVYGQDLQSAQYNGQRINDQFSRASGAASAMMGAQGQDFSQRQANQSNDFSQNMALAQFGSAQDQYDYQAAMAQRQQALNELLQNRQEPMNEIASLMGGSQVSKPSWTATPTSTIQPANLSGLVQSNYQTAMSGYNGMLGGLAGLGGVAAKGLFSLSDERVKHGVKRIARLPSGLGLYSYRFADGRAEIGLLAQEVLLHDPTAVTIRDDGLLAVDYARALEAA